jgi:hypothetical protein
MDVLGPEAELAEAFPYELSASSACSCSAAPTRSTPAPTRSSATSSPSAPRPAARAEDGADARRPPIPGHGLLAGKTVVVTAAAGTGIGFATARAALEEGATRAGLSDLHERRLGEAGGGSPPS